MEIEYGTEVIDKNGVRYFDQDWLKKAREIVKSRRGRPRKG